MSNSLSKTSYWEAQYFRLKNENKDLNNENINMHTKYNKLKKKCLNLEEESENNQKLMEYIFELEKQLEEEKTKTRVPIEKVLKISNFTPERKEIIKTNLKKLFIEKCPKQVDIMYDNKGKPRGGPSIGNRLPKKIMSYFKNDILEIKSKMKGSGYPDGKLKFLKDSYECACEFKTKNLEKGPNTRTVLSCIPNNKLNKNFVDFPNHLIIRFDYIRIDDNKTKSTHITIKGLQITFLQASDKIIYKREINFSEDLLTNLNNFYISTIETITN